MPEDSNNTAIPKIQSLSITALYQAQDEVVDEYFRAIDNFPPMVSPHEGLAIILEEYTELQEEVFKQHDVRDKEAMRKEAKQVAAMALRFMVDLT